MEIVIRISVTVALPGAELGAVTPTDPRELSAGIVLPPNPGTHSPPPLLAAFWSASVSPRWLASIHRRDCR